MLTTTGAFSGHSEPASFTVLNLDRRPGRQRIGIIEDDASA